MKTDTSGFRRKKEVSGGTDTRFLYDLGQIQTPGLAPVVAEYNGSGVLQAKYHSGAAGLLAIKRSGGTMRWYLCDAIGSVRKLAESNGALTDTYLPDAWGNLIASSGSTVNPFRYVGRENYYTDPTDLPDLMLLGVRYYSSSLGRFITPDPIGLSGGDYNLYRYVKDGPVNGTDPRGLLNWGTTAYEDWQTPTDASGGWTHQSVVGGVACFDHPVSEWCMRASVANIVEKYNPGRVSEYEGVYRPARDERPPWPPEWHWMGNLGEASTAKLQRDSGQAYQDYDTSKYIIEQIANSIKRGNPVLVRTDYYGLHKFVIVGVKETCSNGVISRVFFANNSIVGRCITATADINKMHLTAEGLYAHLDSSRGAIIITGTTSRIPDERPCCKRKK